MIMMNRKNRFMKYWKIINCIMKIQIMGSLYYGLPNHSTRSQAGPEDAMIFR